MNIEATRRSFTRVQGRIAEMAKSGKRFRRTPVEKARGVVATGAVAGSVLGVVNAGPAFAHEQHVVKPGQTLSGIARDTGVPVTVLAADNSIKNPDFIRAGQILSVDQPKTASRHATVTKVHVHTGDTLSGIAGKYGTEVSEIAARNRIKNPHKIRAGAYLNVPVNNHQDQPNSTIWVEIMPGDTLTQIARAHKTSVSQLEKDNKIKNPDLIVAGKRLKVPVAAVESKPVDVSVPEVAAPQLFDQDEAEVPAQEVPVEVRSKGINKADLPDITLEEFERIRPLIEKNWPLYEKVAKLENVPPSILAALHYREATNDPERSVWSGQKLGTKNWDHGDNKGNTLEEDARKALQHFKYMARQVYGVEIGMNNTFEELQLAFVAYNRGRMYKSAGESPNRSTYAMSGLSDEYVNMPWASSKGEPKSVRGNKSTQLGALTIVAAVDGVVGEVEEESEVIAPVVDAVEEVETASMDIGQEDQAAEISQAPQIGADGAEIADKEKPLLQKPVEGRISSPFGQRVSPIKGASTMHNGIDIAAPSGTNVAAAGDGVVITAEFNKKGGNIVRIDHGNGVVTGYAHLDKRDVVAGERVVAGQDIGDVGSTGNSSGPHLHLTTRIDGKPVDPKPLFN